MWISLSYYNKKKNNPKFNLRMETSNCNLDVVFALAGNENEVKTFLLVTNLQRSKSRGFFGKKAK